MEQIYKDAQKLPKNVTFETCFRIFKNKKEFLREVRRPNCGTVNIMNKTLYYSGNIEPNHYNGVGVILNDELSALVR